MEKSKISVVFNSTICRLEFSEYLDNANGAILLMSKETDHEELFATATVNTNILINSDFVAIKGWSENSGIEQALIDAEVICSKPVGAVPCGMAIAYIYELTSKAKDLKKQR